MIQTIKKRSDFLKVGKDGIVVKKKSIVVLCLQSDLDKVGYTASRRVGNAVFRNRAKRRLRHLAREFRDILQGGFSFVFIANFQTPIIDFSILRADFKNAVSQIKKSYIGEVSAIR